MKMGGGPKQFGVDAEQVPAAAGARSARAGLAFEGFHLFAGSQNLRAESICEAQQQVATSWRCGWPSTRPAPVRFLNLGGGFGIPYFPGRAAARSRADRRQPAPAASHARAAELPQARIVIELAATWSARPASTSAASSTARSRAARCSWSPTAACTTTWRRRGNFGQVIRKNYPVTIGNRVGAAQREVASVVGPLVHAARPAGRPDGAAGGRDRRPGGGLPVRRLRRHGEPARLPGAPGFVEVLV